MSSFLEIIKSTNSNAIGSLVKKINKDSEFSMFVLNNTKFLSEDSTISFRLYHIREGLNTQIKCKNCKKLLRNHFNIFCGKKCSALYNQNQEYVIIKKKKSISDSYNNKTEEEKELIKTKRKLTNIEKFGVETNLILESNIEKTKLTWIEKYGVDNPNKSQIVKDKVSESNKLSSDQALIKRKNTNVLKYGSENVMNIDYFKDKIKNTNLDRYGETHPMKNEEFYENYFNNSYRKYKFKKYTLPSGKIINLLGYETQVLDYLLTKFDEDDIVTGYDIYKIIESYYIDSDKQKRYIPDFYIKSKNLVIEVKSEYTYRTVDKRKRISIMNKCIKFIYAIYNPKTKTIKFKRYE